MMSRGVAAVLIAMLGAVAVGSTARAQSVDSAGKQRPSPSDPRDTLFLRARGLVLQGNGAAGRALVDSAVAAAAGSSEYANALYWRAALAATAADAERDYRRVIVEYPFAAHAGDALLALAQLEMARGERDPAINHLQRFLLQHPNDPERVRAGIWLGRLLLEQNRLAQGCAVLLRTRSALGDTAVEIRNQVDYYAARCADVDTVSAARAISPTPTRRDTSSPNANKPLADRRYTVQVAAYVTRDSAEKLVSKLSARSIVARIAGTRAPFRVRVGRYATDAEARAAARELKDKGIDGFITTTDVESVPAPVRP